MIYSLKLETALTLVGLWLLVIHAFALLKGPAVRTWLKAFPRSKFLGTVLLVIATVWAWWLIATIDLGEFTDWRDRVKVIIPVAAVLTFLYADEFLAPRALGMIVLLAAEPLLEAAFMRPEVSRLFMVTLVYAWIGLALFWVGMPYTLRDQITWITGSDSRWRLATFAGLAYGALLVVLPLTY
jgi:hypothetical protein